ncbi:hypothetical protein [Nitrosophilus labii]|uniref:hypothetical protein n=1 Tax=Nitrosophilus labii TaxID=2706014 RepID=UPI001657210D|nr:hypothetical protein [Nitrosophilus labii]
MSLNINIDDVFEKIKTPFQKDIFRAKRYEIPITLLVMSIDEKDFLDHFRKSDYLFHLQDDLYILSALFTNYDEGLNMVKRLKREYEFQYGKDLPIFNVTYQKNYPVPDKKMLENILKAFYEVSKK